MYISLLILLSLKRRENKIWLCIFIFPLCYLASINIHGTNMVLKLFVKIFYIFFKKFHSIIPLINISFLSHTCSVQKITPDRLISEVCDIHFGTSIGEKWDRQSYQIAALLFSKQSGKDKCSLFVRLYKFVLPLSSFKVHVIIFDVSVSKCGTYIRKQWSICQTKL